ncbi:MAG TPA: HNH endonuclease [Anaerolineales bacterium]
MIRTAPLSKSERNGLRRRLYAVQGGLCCYCERQMFVLGQESAMKASQRLGTTRGAVFDRQATLEHLHRQADGGGHQQDNFAVACAYCNSHRGARSWVEYKTLRAPRMAA